MRGRERWESQWDGKKRGGRKDCEWEWALNRKGWGELRWKREGLRWIYKRKIKTPCRSGVFLIVTSRIQYSSAPSMEYARWLYRCLQHIAWRTTVLSYFFASSNLGYVVLLQYEEQTVPFSAFVPVSHLADCQSFSLWERHKGMPEEIVLAAHGHVAKPT